MALVTRRYLIQTADEPDMQDQVDPTASVVEVRPRFTDIEIDDAAYPGVLDAIDEFMREAGFESPAVAVPADEAPRSFRPRTVSGSVSLDAQDEFVLIDAGLLASITLTLPLASSVPAGKPFIVKDIGGALTLVVTTTITRSGADLIDGAVSLLLNVAFQSRILVSDGVSRWGVVGSVL